MNIAPIRHLSAKLLNLAICLGLALPSGHSLAEDNAPQWYQVELAIFANDNPAALASEQWPVEPELRYPNTQRFLIDPIALAELRGQPDQQVKVDEFGRIIIDRTSSLTPAIDNLPASAPQPNTSAAPSAQAFAFYLLPVSAHTLTEKIAQLTHSGQRQLLFHQAWQQPMLSNANTLSIVLDDSGNTDSWPRLQGSIQLYVSRYLHLKTHLWLNTYGDYLPHPNWQMPAPPLGPKSLIVRQPELEPLPVNADNEQNIAQENQTLQEQTTQDIHYPWRHAIALQQSRRMRSKELHYIDHPAMGLLIVVTPIATPSE